MEALSKPMRIKSRAVLEEIRAEAERLCQYVDPATGTKCEHPAEGEPHHIRTRGAGGDDRRENLIQLCVLHHRMFHDGNLDRNVLIWIVAQREGISPEEIADILKLSYTPVASLQQSQPTIEELVQAYIQVDEGEQEARFVKGQLLDSMLKAGATQKFLSSQIGVSPPQVRELVRVYRAFPDASKRIPTLSWYHHRVASHANEPVKVLTQASDQSLSVRQMRAEILKNEGKGHLAQDEAENEQKKAEKALSYVREVLEGGSDAALWLIDQLKELLKGVEPP